LYRNVNVLAGYHTNDHSSTDNECSLPQGLRQGRRLARVPLPLQALGAVRSATVSSLWAYGNPGAVWPRFGASTSRPVLALDASNATGARPCST
jgi:hypothetical protein